MTCSRQLLSGESLSVGSFQVFLCKVQRLFQRFAAIAVGIIEQSKQFPSISMSQPALAAKLEPRKGS